MGVRLNAISSKLPKPNYMKKNSSMPSFGLPNLKEHRAPVTGRQSRDQVRNLHEITEEEK